MTLIEIFKTLFSISAGSVVFFFFWAFLRFQFADYDEESIIKKGVLFSAIALVLSGAGYLAEPYMHDFANAYADSDHKSDPEFYTKVRPGNPNQVLKGQKKTALLYTSKKGDLLLISNSIQLVLQNNCLSGLYTVADCTLQLQNVPGGISELKFQSLVENFVNRVRLGDPDYAISSIQFVQQGLSYGNPFTHP